MNSIKDLRGRLTAATVKNKELQAVINQQQETIKNLRADIIRHQTIKLEQKEQITKLDCDLDYYMQQLTAKNTEVAALKDKLSNTTKQIKEITKLADRLENRISKANNSIDALRKKLRNSQAMLTYYKDRVTGGKLDKVKELLDFWDDWTNKHPTHENTPMIAECADELRDVLK